MNNNFPNLNINDVNDRYAIGNSRIIGHSQLRVHNYF